MVKKEFYSIDNLKKLSKEKNNDYFDPFDPFDPINKILKEVNGSNIKLIKTKIKYGENLENVVRNNKLSISNIEDSVKDIKSFVPFIFLHREWDDSEIDEDDEGSKKLGTGVVIFPCYHEEKSTEDDKSNKTNIINNLAPTGIVVALVLGTKGPGPDQKMLENPGHIRRLKGMLSSLDNEKSPIWYRENPLLQKPVSHNFIKTVQEYLDVETAPCLYERDNGKCKGYGQYIYAAAALKFNDKDDNSELEDKGQNILRNFFKFYANERGFWGDNLEFVNDWYKKLYANPTKEEIKSKLDEFKNIILTGPPGVRKSQIIDEITKEYYLKRNYKVQFHPNMNYNNFVGGIQPVLTNNSNTVNFEFKKGKLIEAIEKAEEEKENKNHLLVIDEINRADLSSVLGEAINLFEADKKYSLHIQNYITNNNDNTITMPENLHVIGAMNTADRSISSIDVAIRRRFAFIEMWPEEPYDQNKEKVEDDDGKNHFNELWNIFLEYGSDEDLYLMPGGFYFLKNGEKLFTSFKYRLLPLLKDYLKENRLSNNLLIELEAYVKKLELEIIQKSNENG